MKKYSMSVSTFIQKKDLSEELNIIDASNETKERLLKRFGFDTSVLDLDNSEVTIKVSLDEELVKLNPSVTISYYDENDRLMQRVKKAPNNEDLVSFEGEIYEELSFSSDEEAKKFSDLRGYSMQLYGDTTALIHFKGLEWNHKTLKEVEDVRNLTEENGVFNSRTDEILKGSVRKALEEKEIYVVKTKNMYTIYYSQPLQYMNKGSVGFSEEIDDIEEVVEHLDKNYFVLYVRDALEMLKTNVRNRGYNPASEFIDNKSMSTYINSITDNTVNPNDYVYVKIKVVSDKLVKIDERATQDVNVEKVVGRMFQKIR